MKVHFRFIALVLATNAATGGTLFAQETERVRLSDQTPSTETTSTDKTDSGNAATVVAALPTFMLPSPTLPAAAFGPVNDPTIVVAVEPAVGVQPAVDAQPAAATSVSQPTLAFVPLKALLGVKTVPPLAPLKPIDSGSDTVSVAPPSHIGPPQLPAMARMTEVASTIKPTVTETPSFESIQDPATSAITPGTPMVSGSAEKIDLNSIIGTMKSQEAIFGNLKIQPSAITTEAKEAPDQRLQYLPDGSAAAWEGDFYCWTAPDFFHNPLYFEQVNLERYGQGTYSCLQPAASAAQFFGTIPILPYKIGGQDWNERVYTLGHRRPGNCVPYQVHYHPFSWRGVTYQAAATAGIIFVVP